MHLLRKYLIGSLIFHLLIVLIASLIALRMKNIRQTFVVLGAHSGKPTAVSYKSFKVAVPVQTKNTSPGTVKKIPTNTNDVQLTDKQAKKSVIAKRSPQKKIAEKKNIKKKKSQEKKLLNKTKKIKEPVQAKKTQLQEPVVRPKLQENKKIADKKSEREITKNKAVEKIQPIEKSPVQQPAPIKKPEPERAALQEEASIQKDPESIKQIAKSQEQVVMPDDSSPQIESIAHNVNSELRDQDIELDTIVVGDNDTQYLNEYQKTINQEAARVWRPPVGVPQGTTCYVTFTIARDGTHESDLTQSSPVIIYDLSVMRAARAMKFPKSLWGKQFKIAFRQ